jgi:uncharacterized protein YyaL (SSP411 family)
VRRFIHETSPIFVATRPNPVNWYPWGEKAFQSQEENKLVIISIGYAACHWCHVMEKSFEDVAVAKYMNANFVCIKSIAKSVLTWIKCT